MSVAESTPTNPNKLKIEIVNARINAVVNFKGTEITQHKCNICRLHLMAPTIEDSEKGNLKCQISKGKCNHFFHSDCINKHIKSGNISCPIDFSAWSLDKILDNENKNWNNNIEKKSILDNKNNPPHIEKLIDALLTLNAKNKSN